MEMEEIRLRRMAGQHLLKKEQHHTVLHDLCGVQAQVLSHAFHALRIRSVDFDEKNPEGIMKSWTLRGTMHLFSQADLPLMLHHDRDHFLRPCDTLAEDEYVTAERKSHFAKKICSCVAEGIGDREALRQICLEAGMTPEEMQSVFNPWGGLLRALCEAGKISHAVSEKKAFVPCPAFAPMDKQSAMLELARRYFAHYGPASTRDAAHFLGGAQRDIAPLLEKIGAKACSCLGKTYYYIEETAPQWDEVPACIFLAGFDPLLLGYDKTDNPFLPQAHIRAVYSLSGHVAPTVLLDGRIVGRWKKAGKTLNIALFEAISAQRRAEMIETAQAVFGDRLKIECV